MKFDGIDRRAPTPHSISLEKHNRKATAELVEEIVEEYVEKQSEQNNNKLGWSLESLHISPALLCQIIGVLFTVAVSGLTVYNALEDRISNLESQAELTKVTTNDKIAPIADLQRDVERIKAQDAIFSEMLNALQIKISSMQSKK